MATAQNFFNATPAPDPRQNPMMAGLAGGLQGVANQQGLQQTQDYDMQHQNTDAMQKMMQLMAEQGKFGLGQGGAGTTPETYAGQQGFYNPQGTTPEGALDQEKLDQMVHPDTLKAMGTMLMQGTMKAYTDSHNGLSGQVPMSQDDYANNLAQTAKTLDKWKKLQEAGLPLDGSLDDINKPKGAPAGYTMPNPQMEGLGDYAAQVGQNMMRGPQSMLSAAQKMFGPKNPATGEATGVTANPRAQKLEGAIKDQAQNQIDRALKDKSHTVAQLKDFATQHGWDPNQFNYGGK